MFSTWDELEKVQPLAAKTLKNSLLKNRVAHAYLFEGESGLGKKEVSLLFAKSLFCLEIIDGTNPCEQCSNCRRINSLSHPDVHFLEPDGQSIKKNKLKHCNKNLVNLGLNQRKNYIRSFMRIK